MSVGGGYSLRSVDSMRATWKRLGLAPRFVPAILLVAIPFGVMLMLGLGALFALACVLVSSAVFPNGHP